MVPNLIGTPLEWTRPGFSAEVSEFLSQ